MKLLYPPYRSEARKSIYGPIFVGYIMQQICRLHKKCEKLIYVTSNNLNNYTLFGLVFTLKLISLHFTINLRSWLLLNLWRTAIVFNLQTIE